ncbi:PAS domain-containing sensor histidine kinase [Ramlibacter sp. PS4R-6]|uniref:PAS domain-containing sensor histidine kinase n=1 Tax=Ramlibacter sp. PS4R-6 TaxID=3133438 RepID=UPI0030A4A8AC
MLRESELAQVKVSVREQQLKQRWRTRLLWTLRVLSISLLLVVLHASLSKPFADFDEALDRCMPQPGAQARECVKLEVEARRAVVLRMRDQVLALVALASLTLLVSAIVRFGLQKQLREHALFADQVFDAVPLPLSLRTPDGLYLRVNSEFERRFGVKKRDVTGRHYSAFFTPEIVRIVAEMDNRALASREPVEVEIDLSEPGKPLHAIQRFQAVRDTDGAALGIVIARDDITDLRVSNERLRRLSAQMIDAQEEERRRIARDLHDQVGQILTALKLQLASVAKRGAVDDAATALLLSREFAEEALRHIRDLSASLHPHLLDDLGLEPALNWLIDRFIRPLVPTVDLRCRIAPARAAQEVELVAFRVVQEALTNAARHAQATRIGVILESAEGRLSIEVMDDGVGFEEVNAKRGTSLGLTGMNDRVAEIGGEMAMDSTPGVGTRVRVTLPWALERVAA